MSLPEFETGLRTLGLDVPSDAIHELFHCWDSDCSGNVSMRELATVLNHSAILKPLSHVDLDESPGAMPVAEQLRQVLATNAVKIISLFSSWDQDGNGIIVSTPRPRREYSKRATDACLPHSSICSDLSHLV